MAEPIVLMGLFNEVDPAADALDELRALGISDDEITVISGVPYSHHALGRPKPWERLPFFSLAGALVGFGVGIFFNVGTPLLYSIRVGGQPLVPIPPSAVITYEFTMMGLIIATFLGVLWQSGFPTYSPKYYDPEIAMGRIGIFFRCPPAKEEQARAVLARCGAEKIQRAERRPL